MAKVRLNRKVAVILLGVAVAGGAGIATAHRVQKRIGIENAREVGLQATADGDWERAAGNLKYYLDAEPNDVEALRACATAVLDGYNSRAEAYELLERALKMDPTSSVIRQQQVSLALSLGWTEPASSHIAVLLNRAGDDAEVQYLAGRCEEAAGRSSEAFAFYTQAAKLDPLHVEANRKLLLALAGVPEQTARVEAIATRLMESGDESIQTLTALAKYHTQRQQFDTAYELICRAADAGPLDHESLLLGTRLATRQAAEELAAGRTERALKLVAFWHPQLETAIESQPDATWADVSLAMLQRSAGQHEAALQSLRRVITRVPGQLDLQFQLAWQLLEPGRLNEAEEVVASMPQSPDGEKYRHLLTGLVAAQKQQWADAREKLQLAIETGVDPAVVEIEVRLQHAACCMQADDWPAAETAFVKLLQKYPGHRLAGISLAFCRLARGDYQQAVLDLRRVDGLKILLSGSTDDLSSSAAATALRFQLPTHSILKTLAVSGRRREQAFLTSLLAVCRGEFETAHKVLAEADDAAPDERLFDLVSLSSTGRTVSVDELQSVVAADPEDSRAISALFAAWAHQGEPRQIDGFVRANLTDLNSDVWLQRALVLATACSNSSRMLAAAHPDLGRSLSTYAETLFRKGTELDPSTSWQLVSFLAAHGQREEALTLCRSAWATNPGRIARLWLTQAQSHSDPAAELQVLEQHIKQSLRPDSVDSPASRPGVPEPSPATVDRDSEIPLRLVLGDLSLMTLRYAQAEAEYGRVVELDPSSATAANNLAWLLAMQGHSLDRALELISHAIAVEGRSSNLLDTRACVRLARDEASDALADLNEAASQAKSADIEFHRAVAFQRLGQKQAAVECLQRAGQLGFDLHQRPPLEHPMCLELRDLWAELVATNLP